MAASFINLIVIQICIAFKTRPFLSSYFVLLWNAFVNVEGGANLILGAESHINCTISCNWKETEVQNFAEKFHSHVCMLGLVSDLLGPRGPRFIPASFPELFLTYI